VGKGGLVGSGSHLSLFAAFQAQRPGFCKSREFIGVFSVGSWDVVGHMEEDTGQAKDVELKVWWSIVNARTICACCVFDSTYRHDGMGNVCV
jgi:hypothetical protein